MKICLGHFFGACLVAALLPAYADPIPAAYEPLPVGSVEPEGWIRAQMTNDAVDGMAGHFIELRPNYGSVSWVTENGNAGAGEMGGNWIDGFVRMAWLTGNPVAKKKADDFVQDVLRAADPDGYIGNIKPEKGFKAG